MILPKYSPMPVPYVATRPGPTPRSPLRRISGGPDRRQCLLCSPDTRHQNTFGTGIQNRSNRFGVQPWHANDGRNAADVRRANHALGSRTVNQRVLGVDAQEVEATGAGQLHRRRIDDAAKSADDSSLRITLDLEQGIGNLTCCWELSLDSLRNGQQIPHQNEPQALYTLSAYPAITIRFFRIAMITASHRRPLGDVISPQTCYVFLAIAAPTLRFFKRPLRQSAPAKVLL